MTEPLVTGSTDGRTTDLGVVRFRLIAGADATGGAFSLAEFSGQEGPWTVPHVHREMEESFYVLAGRFTFTIAGEEIKAGPDTYLLVPRGTAHVMRAHEGGGRFVTLMVPGGLEEMFFELGSLSADALRDPEARRAVSAKYDSIPVES
ncbi:MAG TPA: cupin domain-containing protein [Actinomycetota bacterium]|nr:cupin domain-containing protein [Actinomycetota bacterium]